MCGFIKLAIKIRLLPGHPGLFVRSTLAAPLTKFLEFKLTLHLFLIFGGVVISSFADCAF